MGQLRQVLISSFFGQVKDVRSTTHLIASSNLRLFLSFLNSFTQTYTVLSPSLTVYRHEVVVMVKLVI